MSKVKIPIEMIEAMQKSVIEIEIKKHMKYVQQLTKKAIEEEILSPQFKSMVKKEAIHSFKMTFQDDHLSDIIGNDDYQKLLKKMFKAILK